MLAVIPGWPKYAARADGVIFSLKCGEPRAIAQQVGKKGYVSVNLCANGRTYWHSVHRLVLLAFRGEPRPGEEGCHNDGNQRNNALSNLRWDTASSNIADKVRHGATNHGTKCPVAKIDGSIVASMREARAGNESLRSIAKRFGVTCNTVYCATTGRTWSRIKTPFDEAARRGSGKRGRPPLAASA